jgi:hypothetical protein
MSPGCPLLCGAYNATEVAVEAFHVTSRGLRLCIADQPRTFDCQADAAVTLDNDPPSLDRIVKATRLADSPMIVRHSNGLPSVAL